MYRFNFGIEQLGFGAKIAAWLPSYQNPLFSPVGAGIFPIFNWQATEGAIWVNQSVPVTGLAGIQTGDARLQPLIDTRRGVNGL